MGREAGRCILRLSRIAILAGVAALGGCSPAPSDLCVPGEAVSCTGPGGCRGGQVCSSDGASFRACECTEPPGDAGRDAPHDSSTDHTRSPADSEATDTASDVRPDGPKDARADGPSDGTVDAAADSAPRDAGSGGHDEGAPDSPSDTGSATCAVPCADAGFVPWQSVQLGAYAGCGLRGGKAYCWGNDVFGVTGNGAFGSGPSFFSPQLAAGGLTSTQIAVGGVSACAIGAAGELYCWGLDDEGQVGGCPPSGVGDLCLTPIQPLGTMAFASVSVGRDQACAIDMSGNAYCWGSNQYGALGSGPVSDAGALTYTPVLGGPYVKISNGQDFTCALDTAGKAYCWGLNTSGQLGIGTTTGPDGGLGKYFTPTPVAGGLTFAALSAGAFFACGVTTGGAGYCWGRNEEGELGTGDTVDHYTPTPVDVPSSVQLLDIETGGFGACGITTTGQLLCWGETTDTLAHLVTEVPCLPPIAQVTVGGTGAVCALTSAGARYCWGDNVGDGAGQLGDGTMISRSTAEPLDTICGPPQLAVSVGPAAEGTVASSDTQIECGTDGGSCVGNYTNGASVVLTATPASGYGVLWGEACAPSNVSSTCTVDVEGTTSVTATFAPLAQITIVNAEDAGAELWPQPAQNPYQDQYPEGATVAALASSPYGSMGWLPAPLGTPNPCSGQRGECVFVMPPSCAVDLISTGNYGCQIYPQTHP